MNLNVIKKPKVQLLIAQLYVIGLGYLVQLITFKIFLSQSEFSIFQFSNYLTNFLGLFIGTTAASLLSKYVAHKKNITIENVTGKFLIYLGYQTLLCLGITLILVLGRLISGTLFWIIGLSLLQVVFFSLLNGIHLFLIGTDNKGKFIFSYCAYASLKALGMISMAFLIHSAWGVILGIILAGMIQTFVMVRLLPVKYSSATEHVMSWQWNEFVQQLLVNLSIFGVLNMSFIVSFFKIGTNTASSQAFNATSLLQPIAMLPYYVLSSLGNYYLVEFKKESKHPYPTLVKFFSILLLLSFGSAFLGVLVLSILRISSYDQLLTSALTFIPFAVGLTMLQIIFSIYQGLDRMHELFGINIALVPIYLVVLVLSPTLSMTFIIVGLLYVTLVIALLIRMRHELHT